MTTILAADVGGTKVQVARYVVQPGDRWEPMAIETYPSREHASLEAILAKFLAKHPGPVEATGIGVAGPVFERRCQATNLPWMIDAAELERALPLGPVALVNDFKAVALGVLRLRHGDWIELNPEAEPADPRGPIAILGAGTGLGEAFLIPADGRHHVLSSEGGHVDFAPRTDDEIGLLRFLRKRHGRVSYERVVSGMGIAAIYDYCLEDAGEAKASPTVLDAMAEGADQAEAVSLAAAAGTDPLASRAMTLFAAVYGAEAGNLALKVIATGGVYLAGGIAKKNMALLQSGGFLEAYGTKGRFSPLVKRFPLRLITHPNVGLLGAAAAAIEHDSRG